MRVHRKVKLEGKWVMARVPFDRAGKPDAKHVLHKGVTVPVNGGTFYIETGRGKSRKHLACGEDPEGVRRALKTQLHVMELRRRGMEVDDAPEIAERRKGGESLRDVATDFRQQPPPALARSSVSKYANAHETFAEWAACSQQIFNLESVKKETVERWISHLKKTGLDGSTITDKVRIVLAELKRHENPIVLDKGTLPRPVERERDIYSPGELQALFRGCTLEEYERYQTFLLTGFREMEVAFLQWSDVDPDRHTIRIKRKRELGFTPKTYHERTVPVPQSLIDLLQGRGERLGSDGAGLIFGTRQQLKRGNMGMKADKKMLQKLKTLAFREGLNCGMCKGYHQKKPVTCATHAVCHNWMLHKFRHTYATAMLRDRIDIVTVSKWLGHKDIATTRIYLRALDAEMAQPQVESSTLATRFAGHPPKVAGDRRAPRAF